MDFEPYAQLSPNHDDVDRPTMGSMWCLRRVRYIVCFTYCYMPSQLYDLAVNIFFIMQPSWVGVQMRKSYHDFVG